MSMVVPCCLQELASIEENEQNIQSLSQVSCSKVMGGQVGRFYTNFICKFKSLLSFVG